MEIFTSAGPYWLILHVRYVYRARKPDCPLCVVNDLCRYRAKTLA